MPSYMVTVATGTQGRSGTNNSIYITLVGTLGCSQKTILDKSLHDDFERGSVDSFPITVEENLGEIVLLKLQKKARLAKDDWYARYVSVRTPGGEDLDFPCYRWLVDDKEVVLRDGRAQLPQDEKTGLLRQHRKEELEMRRKAYGWTWWQPGFPMSIDAKRYRDLPRDIQFDTDKGLDFVLNYSKAISNLFLNHLVHMFQSSWKDFADFKKIFLRIKNNSSEYVMQHWKEDFLFGYQFLNGCNPVLIQKIGTIPPKFPVTNDMVAGSLERGLTLDQEVKAGNIYMVDYEVLDGIKANDTDPRAPQYMTAPICLLYKNTEDDVIPIAIQLAQSPGESNPIFLPSDGEYDWLLAKMWVRSSDFQHHQTVTHLLRTHLMSEMFAIAMFRQLAAVHPVFKLLVPHIRFTIAINTKAREELICERGLFDKANATGGGGHVQLVQKVMKTLTFTSLCFPDEMVARGMDSEQEVPPYFYRNDGRKVWEATKSFVFDVIHAYYSGDEEVRGDPEIQAFVKDVHDNGMRDFHQSEFPQSLQSREELIQYLTIIVFTASAQHAAVNFGQYDWYAWIPNAPSTMRKPPPDRKGSADMSLIMATLPDRGRSTWHLGAVWALSQYQKNEIYLGIYPDGHFVDEKINAYIEKFQKTLKEIGEGIQARNRELKCPYSYMSPDKIPNSVAI
ncbi:polyunsaturated fatty acid 5-lipoxygenase-like [Stigmatopora nigra]